MNTSLRRLFVTIVLVILVPVQGALASVMQIHMATDSQNSEIVLVKCHGQMVEMEVTTDTSADCPHCSFGCSSTCLPIALVSPYDRTPNLDRQISGVDPFANHVVGVPKRPPRG